MISVFSKSIDLKIIVQSDEILLLGDANEAAGKMLQGSLILNISEPIKVKSVNLSFVGKMKVSWSEGGGHHQNLHKQERTNLSHTWAFVKPQLTSKSSNSQLLPAGQHKWNFELLLPGNLAQTLDSDVGSVSYCLKATIERSAFIQNTVKKRDIRIVRCILPSHFELVQSLEIHNTWAQKMVYDIGVPSKLYAFNDTIPISFKILPIAPGLKVHAITTSIKEYCTYTANGHTKTDTRIVRLVRVDHPFSEATYTATSPPTWDRVLDLTVPSNSPTIFANSADNDMIRIRHRLKFVISLSNGDGHRSELRCAVQITVVESFAVTEELTTLPAYDESWRSVPYDPHVVEQLRTRTSISEAGTNEPIFAGTALSKLQDSRQPVSITGGSRTTLSLSSVIAVPDRIDEHAEERSSSETTFPSRPMTIPGSNSGSRHHSRRPSMEFEENSGGVSDLLLAQEDSSFTGRPLWWNGIDLGKVPSYRSVSTLNQDLFSASLPPAYDSLVAALANASPCRL